MISMTVAWTNRSGTSRHQLRVLPLLRNTWSIAAPKLPPPPARACCGGWIPWPRDPSTAAPDVPPIVCPSPRPSVPHRTPRTTHRRIPGWTPGSRPARIPCRASPIPTPTVGCSLVVRSRRQVCRYRFRCRLQRPLRRPARRRMRRRRRMKWSVASSRGWPRASHQRQTMVAAAVMVVVEVVTTITMPRTRLPRLQRK